MNIINKINLVTKYLTIRFFYAMFLIVLFNILTRYIFNINFIFLQELTMYLHAFVFLFGISLCFRENAHVKIDILSSRVNQNTLAKISLLGNILFVLPFCFFVIYVSTPMIVSSWAMLEGSSEPGGLPLIYLLKSSIYLFSFLIIVEVIHKLLVK